MLIKDALGVGKKAVERERAQETGRQGQKPAQAPEAGAGQGGADRVEISGRSKEMAKAHEAVSSAPEVRGGKVEAIKERIAKGEYEVDADKVAEKMIVDFLNDIV
jgi:negative regulator of flagellin synthesis FlgM